MYGSVLSTVADALVLKHMTISIPIADQIFIALDQFHRNITVLFGWVYGLALFRQKLLSREIMIDFAKKHQCALGDNI